MKSILAILILVITLSVSIASAATIHVPSEQPTIQAAQQRAVSHIVSVSPTQNELNVSVSTNISVTFDIDMDPTTINDATFVVHDSFSGMYYGVLIFDSYS